MEAEKSEEDVIKCLQAVTSPGVLYPHRARGNFTGNGGGGRQVRRGRGTAT